MEASRVALFVQNLGMFEDESHRTCPECGGDCTPEILEAMRVAFACPTHGVHTVVDPLEGQR